MPSRRSTHRGSGYRIGKEWRVERSRLMEWLERHSNQRVRPLSDRWFDHDGRLTSMPAQRAKRRAVLERIVERLEPRRRYTERELNEVLRTVYDDVAYVRREMVAEGMLTRSRGVYVRG